MTLYIDWLVRAPDGSWFVEHLTTRDSEPVLVRMWWRALQVQRREHGRLVEENERIHYQGFGVYHGATASVRIDGSAQAVRVEESPIAAPKRAKVTRWRFGCWQKHIAQHGWVDVPMPEELLQPKGYKP